MKVRLLVSRGGAFGIQNRGDVVEVSDSDGVSMIAAGQAEPVRSVAPEKAIKRAKPEKARK